MESNEYIQGNQNCIAIKILDENDQVKENVSNENDDDSPSQDQEIKFEEVEVEEEVAAKSCRTKEEGGQGNQNDSDNDSAIEENRQVEENTIEGYYESFSSKSLKETLQFQKKNIFDFPSWEENIHPLTLEKRAVKDTIIAIASFLLR